MGILKFKDSKISGEEFFIHQILAKYLDKVNKPVLFDVGANTGEYTHILAKKFDKSVIFSFEPNSQTFQHLAKETFSNVNYLNIGLGAEEKKDKIYTYSDNLMSQHATIHKDVLVQLHRSVNLTELDFQMETIDNFCKKQSITKIDFLKIDTEGHELEVLKGASEMLSGGKISLIQFEFNEMNIISRVFLKDFYLLLSHYKLFRIDTDKLIPLTEYSSRNEIFQFQNLVAIYKDVYEN
jgi:FkbM family methyltransferase